MREKKRKSRRERSSTSAPKRERVSVEKPSRRRGGPAQALMDFAQPLLEAAGDNVEAMDKAMSLAMMAWNLALLVPPDQREEELDKIVNALGLAEGLRQEMKGIIRSMIQRHEEMFPFMHSRRERSER